MFFFILKTFLLLHSLLFCVHIRTHRCSLLCLSPFLLMRFYTCWLNDCHFLRIMCARCWPPPVRRLTAVICVSVVETGPSLSWFLAPPLDALQSYKVFTQHQYNPSHFSCLRRNLLFGLSVAYQVFSHKLPPSACMDVGRYRHRLQGGNGIKNITKAGLMHAFIDVPKEKVLGMVIVVLLYI